MIEGLRSIGYQWDIGEDETGHQMKYRRRCGGYYLDAGCSQLLIDGEIGLLQFDAIERFVPEGALLKDGTVRHADLLVLATGYHTQQEMVRRLLGDEIGGSRRPGLGHRRAGRDGEYVEAHPPAWPLVHGRRPDAEPHLFQIRRHADQGHRTWLYSGRDTGLTGARGPT